MRPPLIASFLLIFFLTACAAPTAVLPTVTLTPIHPTATSKPFSTATQPAPTEGAGNGETVVPTAIPEIVPAETETPIATQPAETLLPPDFVVRDDTDFRTAILPYCYVEPELNNTHEGGAKWYEEVQGFPIWQEIVDMFNSGKIVNVAPAVMNAPGGGGCGTILVWEGADHLITKGYFRSRLDPMQFIEIIFTNPNSDKPKKI